MTDDASMINGNQGNDAITIRTKLVDQYGFRRLAKAARTTSWIEALSFNSSSRMIIVEL